MRRYETLFIVTPDSSEEELKAEYDKKMGGDNAIEYKARHILVKTQDEGKKIIEQLDKGANFEELAKKESTGPSASKGGDLGWFGRGVMVKEFEEAAFALEESEVSETVKTEFRWHLIKLIEKR